MGTQHEHSADPGTRKRGMFQGQKKSEQTRAGGRNNAGWEIQIPTLFLDSRSSKMAIARIFKPLELPTNNLHQVHGYLIFRAPVGLRQVRSDTEDCKLFSFTSLSDFKNYQASKARQRMK